MNNVVDVFSILKDSLNNIITKFNNKIVEIEKEEEFFCMLSDLVNYSKSDFTLLPFYDGTILSRIFDRVFPFSQTELNKIKAAKYLIDASRNVDTSHFLQYNNALKDIEIINNKIVGYYEKLLSNSNFSSEKDNYNNLIDKYLSILNIIGDDCFISLIDDIDLFEEVIMSLDLSIDEVDIILDIAIRDNLKFLNDTGVFVENEDDDIINMKQKNSEMQDAINDLSNLLDASV